MLIFIFTMIILTVSALLSVAFFTLMERKILGISQIRLGPNKVLFFGIFQPVLDGIKLFKKFNLLLNKKDFVFFNFFPFIVFFIWILLWLLSPMLFFFNLKMIFFFVFLILGTLSYFLMIVGWSSSNIYGKMGAIRNLVITISFEMIFFFFFLIFFFLQKSFNLFFYCFTLEFVFLFFFAWLILNLIENNRAPFDLTEGESELISGFNIEMSSLNFIFLFLSEYGMILFFSFLLLSLFKNFFMSMMVFFIVLITRNFFPRIRFDMIIYISWIILLPFLISFFLFVYIKIN